MLKLYLPPVPPLTGGNVIVSKDVWVSLIQYIESMQTVINAQAEAITKLSKDNAESKKHIAEIAKAVGGLYNET
jgi:hypothetical protein